MRNMNSLKKEYASFIHGMCFRQENLLLDLELKLALFVMLLIGGSRKVAWAVVGVPVGDHGWRGAWGALGGHCGLVIAWEGHWNEAGLQD